VGDYYYIDYNYSTESTAGEIEVEYALNESAVIKGNTEMIVSLEKKVDDIEKVRRTETHIKNYYIDTDSLGSFSVSDIFRAHRPLEIVGVRFHQYGVSGVDASNTLRIKLLDSTLNVLCDETWGATPPSGYEDLAVDPEYVQLDAGDYVGISHTLGATVTEGQYNYEIEYRYL
jgi:hypothetical protein